MKLYQCKEDKIFKFLGDKIVVKQYVDYKMKNLLIAMIIQGLKDEFGTFIPSPLSLDLGFTYGILKFYTDLDVENDNLIDLYNNVKGSGLFNEILKRIPKEELISLREMIDKSIIIESSKDNILNVIKNFLDTASEKLPDAEIIKQSISTLGEEIKQMNPMFNLGAKTKIKDFLK